MNRQAYEPWFYAAIAVGLAVRLFFVFATPGTLDVDSWLKHTIALEKQSLISYYQVGTLIVNNRSLVLDHPSLIFNHPPPSALLVSTIGDIATATHIQFAALLRLPFVFVDLASVALMLGLLGNTRQSRILATLYWLHPLAIIYSAYHGNTDTAIAFFLLATTLLVTRNQALFAGVALGACLWIKIPGVLVAPVFLFVLPTARQRVEFCLGVGATALVGYGPALVQNARAVMDAVIFYPGLDIHTSSGISTWGLRTMFPAMTRIPVPMRLGYLEFVDFIKAYNTVICVLPMVVFAWLRRHERSALGVANTIAASYAIFYGLTNFWAFQYFAWVIPFWVMSTRWFAISASVVATVYIYGCYAWLCGDALLMGPWDFIGRPDWPSWLLAARNTANLFFFATGLFFLFRALFRAVSQARPQTQEA